MSECGFPINDFADIPDHNPWPLMAVCLCGLAVSFLWMYPLNIYLTYRAKDHKNRQRRAQLTEQQQLQQQLQREKAHTRNRLSSSSDVVNYCCCLNLWRSRANSNNQPLLAASTIEGGENYSRNSNNNSTRSILDVESQSQSLSNSESFDQWHSQHGGQRTVAVSAKKVSGDCQHSFTHTHTHTCKHTHTCRVVWWVVDSVLVRQVRWGAEK
jgi:hypothetical protein